jgi:hypothetical protein
LAQQENKTPNTWAEAAQEIKRLQAVIKQQQGDLKRLRLELQRAYLRGYRNTRKCTGF